jgi:U3 small nucleolar RNA-associated protein 20
MLSELAQYLTDSSQASTFLGLFSPLLRKPSKVVSEKVKADMIKIVSSLVPLVPELGDPESIIHTKTYALLAQLLQSLRARPARIALISAFQRFSILDHSLLPVAELVDSLNAYSSRRIEEPDFDRRMGAFAKLNEEFRTTFSPKQWLPILYNMLYFIQDPTELAIRTNSAHTLRCFIDITASAEDKQWEITFLKVLYPGLKNGLRSKNEMVRGEVLSVIAHAVAQCRDLATLQEMRILLADGDEEANFFNNIHHVQLHRRTRALRRLADYCQEGRLRSSTLAEVFVPLVGNFISTTDVIDHHLVNEAIITTGRMACHLGWGAYNTLIHQYLRQMDKKDASERVYVRAVVAILDNFHFPMEEPVPDADAVRDEDL